MMVASRKVIAIAAVAAIALSTVGILFRSSPPEVIGDLSDTEREQISNDVREKMRKPMFPALSLSGFQEGAEEFWRRLRTRILRIERRTDVFVVVFTATESDLKSPSCRFWSVVRGTNGWTVGDEYWTSGR